MENLPYFSWMLRCLLSANLSAKAAEQISHLNGFSPEWTCKGQSMSIPDKSQSLKPIPSPIPLRDFSSELLGWKLIRRCHTCRASHPYGSSDDSTVLHVVQILCHTPHKHMAFLRCGCVRGSWGGATGRTACHMCYIDMAFRPCVSSSGSLSKPPWQKPIHTRCTCNSFRHCAIFCATTGWSTSRTFRHRYCSGRVSHFYKNTIPRKTSIS